MQGRIELTSQAAFRAAWAFQAALDLHEVGLSLMRQNLRRAYADASADRIDEHFRRWLHDRPGAEAGDRPGRVIVRREPAL